MLPQRQKKALAVSTGMREKQVANWFQNTRTNHKVTAKEHNKEKVVVALATKKETKTNKEFPRNKCLLGVCLYCMELFLDYINNMSCRILYKLHHLVF